MRALPTLAGMELEFTVILRGYDRDQVDAVLRQADRALASGDATACAAAAAALKRADFTVVLRGYDRPQVDEAVQERLRRLHHPGQDVPEPERGLAPDDFTVVLRGYDMAQVAALLADADTALASSSAVARARARDTLSGVVLRQRLRGYAREQVDRAVRQRLEALA